MLKKKGSHTRWKITKTCCEDGMRDSPMGHSCERRSQKILEGKECVDAFVECCKHFEKKKADERTTKDEDLRHD
uniref:Anaphylatoxin-like domain-containing protein n=1 Tax=Leptobrachium leishanense TaxID=445787 RepID=A0A8C5WIH2_9ANUR